jgi:hypothetical protein
MRYIAITCACVFLGFVLGRWAPTLELRQMREELREARSGRRGSALSGMNPSAAATEFLRIERPRRRRRPGPTVAETNAVADAASPAPGSNAVAEAVAPEPGLGDDDGEDQGRSRMEKRIEAAKEAWRARSDLARTSFLDNLGASEEESLRFDVLIEAMNIRIGQTIDSWVDRVEQQEVVRAEDGARLMHELTGAVVLTYDEIDRSFGPEWREKSDDRFMLVDFVDPSVADSLVEVEDLIDKSPF